MVNTLFAVAALCMTSVLLCKVLERYAREQAVMLTIGTAAGVLLLLLTMLEPLLTARFLHFSAVEGAWHLLCDPACRGCVPG